MSIPHKHCELIKQWADGAEIQYKNDFNEWEDWEALNSPPWFDDDEYRIKPEEKKPVVRWLWADKEGVLSECLRTEEEMKQFEVDVIKLEWSRTEFPE